MPRPSRCIVEQCPNPAHAKGYCRRHYGQIWRRGMIYDTSKRQRDEDESLLRRDDLERMRALERELQKAQQMYEVVVGFEGRVKWRRQIVAVQEEIRHLNEAQAQPAEAKPATTPAAATAAAAS